MGAKENIINYIKEHGSITQLETYQEFGYTRLPSLIHRLRTEGYNIITTNETVKNKYGQTVTYARYSFGDTIKKEA